VLLLLRPPPPLLLLLLPLPPPLKDGKELWNVCASGKQVLTSQCISSTGEMITVMKNIEIMATFSIQSVALKEKKEL